MYHVHIDSEFAKALQKQQGKDDGEYGASFPWSSHHEIRRTCAARERLRAHASAGMLYHLYFYGL
jgi:hypothetical protein